MCSQSSCVHSHHLFTVTVGSQAVPGDEDYVSLSVDVGSHFMSSVAEFTATGLLELPEHSLTCWARNCLMAPLQADRIVTKTSPHPGGWKPDEESVIRRTGKKDIFH